MTAASIFTAGKSTWADFMSNTFTDYITTDVAFSNDMPATHAFAQFLKDNAELDIDTGGIDAFMAKVDKVAKKPTDRTVYMDSNIALTDGRKHAKDPNARVIPNLFDTIEGLRVGEEILAQKINVIDETVDLISGTHGPSTADAGLFVREYTSANDPYQTFLRDSVDGYKPGVEIIAGNKLNDTTANGNATSDSDAFNHNMHFKANEITFTVSNPNTAIHVAYLLSDAINKDMFDNFDIHSTADNLIKAWTATKTLYNDCLDDIDYYFVPVEDNENITGNITENNDNANDYDIAVGVHGKVFMNFPYKQNKSFKDVEIVFNGISDTQLKEAARGIYGIMKKNGTCVYLPHIVTKSVLKANHKKENSLKVTDQMTYNLGAIIEAIQELNRRTMFMDIDMSFNGAMSYGDYVSGTVTAGAYGKINDGLPGATDIDTGKHYAGV